MSLEHAAGSSFAGVCVRNCFALLLRSRKALPFCRLRKHALGAPRAFSRSSLGSVVQGIRFQEAVNLDHVRVGQVYKFLHVRLDSRRVSSQAPQHGRRRRRGHQPHLERLLDHEAVILHQRGLVGLLGSLVGVHPLGHLREKHEDELQCPLEPQECNASRVRLLLRSCSDLILEQLLESARRMGSKAFLEFLNISTNVVLHRKKHSSETIEDRQEMCNSVDELGCISLVSRGAYGRPFLIDSGKEVGLGHSAEGCGVVGLQKNG
mmetsp:Transcript_49619/g.117022  ORF Transcript_49619/g.117022 Transcript_49619/m.117022 type:complete len:264 (-) Transcript_49619:210-1001(-)